MLVRILKWTAVTFLVLLLLVIGGAQFLPPRTTATIPFPPLKILTVWTVASFSCESGIISYYTHFPPSSRGVHPYEIGNATLVSKGWFLQLGHLRVDMACQSGIGNPSPISWW